MALPRLLQFNYESSVSYNDDGYATLSVKGVLEIPLTRDPNQATRTFAQTADAFRGEIERRVMSGVDLTRFRMVRRNFSLSRDKRVLSWDFQAEEKAYMDLPAYATVARGSYSVRPAKAGLGLITWLCTLRATYTIRADVPRRLAWNAFLALLRHRMACSEKGNIDEKPAAARPKVPPPPSERDVFLNTLARNTLGNTFAEALFPLIRQEKPVEKTKKALLTDFSFDEGLYLDSKTITFSATWKIMTNISHILLASGIWRRVEGDNRDLWATSVQSISGAQSWYAGVMEADVIVDFGGGDGVRGPAFGRG